jgi:dipeptidyl aminopeptidase/acylaminoacyl peptidase
MLPRYRLAILFLALISVLASAKPAPKSIEALRSAVRQIELVEVGDVSGGPGYSAKLYQYQSAGLRVHALLARPSSAPPKGGWPVLIANHGHHPTPQLHGITASGVDHRPGDYYRKIPELFVARGFVVVMPDYRGHSNSEGFEFTEGLLESAYYTEDVLNLLAGLDGLEDIDVERMFMWGHSMGGEVTLRALLATNKIKAASLWSSVGGSIWDQSYYYSRYDCISAPDSSDEPKDGVVALREQIANLDSEFDTRSVEPYLHLDELTTPLLIQHAIDDRSAAFHWSERLAGELSARGMLYEFWPVPGDAHLFDDETMEVAADRDLAFFERWATRH